MTGTRFGGEFAPGRDLLAALLARNWWAIGIRGVLAVVFGLIALFLPGAWLRQGSNDVVVFDLDGGSGKTLEGRATPLLNSPAR